MVVVGKCTVVLIITADSVCIGSEPKGTVGCFKNGPYKRAAQAVDIKRIILEQGEPVGLGVQDADPGTKCSKPQGI